MKRWLIPAGILVVLGVVVGLRSASAQTQVWPRSGQSVELFDFAGSGRLGVTVRDLEASDVARDKLQGEHGAVVTGVTAASAAEKAGLRKGDVVIEFDGEPVRSASQFTRLVRETPIGRKVKIAVVREGRRTDLTVAPEGSTGAVNTDELRRELENGLRSRRFFYRMPDDRGLNVLPPEGDWQVLPRPFGRPPLPGEPSPRSPFGPRQSDRGRMGVTIQELTPQLAEYFGTKDGLLISTVVDDSAAAKAGLKAGDIITAIDSHSVSSADDLRRRLERAPAGAEVTLDIVRNHKTQQVKVKLDDAGKARIVPL